MIGRIFHWLVFGFIHPDPGFFSSAHIVLGKGATGVFVSWSTASGPAHFVRVSGELAQGSRSIPGSIPTLGQLAVI